MKTAHGGRPQPADGFVQGQAGSVRGGTLVALWLRLEADTIREARFEVFGAPAAIACAEHLCAGLAGRATADARRITGLELAEALSLPAARRGVALVVEDALKAALAAGGEAEQQR